jgi:hypothetical protein
MKTKTRRREKNKSDGRMYKYSGLVLRASVESRMIFAHRPAASTGLTRGWSPEPVVVERTN